MPGKWPDQPLDPPFGLSEAAGSLAVRQLYTDDEEVLFQAARPTLLNGIEDVIGRPDLADRAIFLTMAPIDERERRPEAELWRKFERRGLRFWTRSSMSSHTG